MGLEQVGRRKVRHFHLGRTVCESSNRHLERNIKEANE